ncbi:MAG TPA: DDE-type integrase/transposase/recombinase [Castellaniella sp.]|uniref:DDE-type integrase/transposase/recombinase n=1 Tax=Castellaniella sp. TaxID=1955812 RepID=UPI002F0A0CA0
MLNKEQLIELFDRLGTPVAGRKLVLEARIHAPVRQVQSRGSNVTTVLASRKMGCEIRTESRHIEFPAAVDHEFDPTVLEFYPQPCKLALELVEPATGEVHNIHHTPDFLVIRRDGILLEECKSAEKLARLAQQYPYRYQQNEDGGWISPLIEAELAAYGIGYHLCTDQLIPRHRVENLLHLADYFHPAADPCDPQELLRLEKLLSAEGALYLSELTTEPHGFSPDFLFKAVADGLVAADLDREPLTQPRRARLYRDVTLRDFMANQGLQESLPGEDHFVLDVAQGAVFTYDGRPYTVSMVGERELVCADDSGRILSLERDWVTRAFAKGQLTPVRNTDRPRLDLARYTEADLSRALQRQQILAAPSLEASVSARTLRSWRARQQAVAGNGGNEALALVPQTAARGNRTARLSDTQETLLCQVINKRWKSHEAINFKACYRFVCIAFDEVGEKAPSYPTVIARIKAMQTEQDVRTRWGKRMAYQKGEFASVLYYETPVHGSRPFQYVHIDHTQLDVELLDATTDKPLGRPWLTFAVDAYSRRIVALYLTFDPPSYHSVMMIVRDMVKRYGRLPEFFVVDNGRDLISQSFTVFLQLMGVHLRMRPAGHPRAGAIMERVFGTVNTQYVHNLAGNTKATKQVRMTTGKHLPVNFAQWTLESLYYGLSHWAFDYYDCEPHPALGCSPRARFQAGLRDAGGRPHREILFTRDFLIATCPPADRGGVRVIDYQRGVKVHDRWYWNPSFQNARNARKKVAVRYDPWDAATVYIWLADQWLPATCRALGGLGQMTEYERRALTEEYASRGGKTTDDPQSAQRLREFIQVFTPEGAMAAEHARQQENKSLYDALGLASVAPVAPAHVPPVAPANATSVSKDISGARPRVRIEDRTTTTGSRPAHSSVELEDLPKFDTF